MGSAVWSRIEADILFENMLVFLKLHVYPYRDVTTWELL